MSSSILSIFQGGSLNLTGLEGQGGTGDFLSTLFGAYRQHHGKQGEAGIGQDLTKEGKQLEQLGQALGNTQLENLGKMLEQLGQSLQQPQSADSSQDPSQTDPSQTDPSQTDPSQTDPSQTGQGTSAQGTSSQDTQNGTIPSQDLPQLMGILRNLTHEAQQLIGQGDLQQGINLLIEATQLAQQVQQANPSGTSSYA